MKRRELEVTNPDEILQILQSCKVLNLALCDGDQPYVLPMNFGYHFQNGKLTLYLHGATSGYKYEMISKNSKVAFSMFTDVVPFTGAKPCQYGNAYYSILGKGTIRILDKPQEKIEALTTFMLSQTGEKFEFNEKLVSIVNVMEIDVAEFSAKHRPLPEKMRAEQ